MFQGDGTGDRADHVDLPPLQPPGGGEGSRSEKTWKGTPSSSSFWSLEWEATSHTFTSTSAPTGSKTHFCPIPSSRTRSVPVQANGSLHPISACKNVGGGFSSHPGAAVPQLHTPTPLLTLVAPAPRPQPRNSTVVFTQAPRTHISPNPVSKLQGIGDGGTQKDDGDVVRQHDEHLLPHDPTLDTHGGDRSVREQRAARSSACGTWLCDKAPPHHHHSPQHH